jgi:hypothetical protein
VEKVVFPPENAYFVVIQELKMFSISKRVYSKSGLILAFLFIFSTVLHAETLIVTRKAARIGNDLILVKDVEKHAGLYSISYDEALAELIGQSLLYQGAKAYTEEPTEDEINRRIRDDKAYYASRSGRNASEVTDEEFLAAIHMNSYSMKTYREYVKKQLWVSNYIYNEVQKQQIKLYFPTESEIQEVIDSKPEMFEEKKGVELSMIYFSHFDSMGNVHDEKKLTLQKQRAAECLKRLVYDEPFELMVNEYSDDLISLNTIPRGFVGRISLDDPRSLRSFSQDILDAFEKNDVGLIEKVFETVNGLYIFKIDRKIEPRVLPEEAMRQKAESWLQNEYNLNLRNSVKENLMKKMEKVTDITIY